MKISYIKDSKEALSFVLGEAPELMNRIIPEAKEMDGVYCAGRCRNDPTKFFVVERNMNADKWAVLLIESATPDQAEKVIQKFFEFTQKNSEKCSKPRLIEIDKVNRENN